jgi:hypothetical protein
MSFGVIHLLQKELELERDERAESLVGGGEVMKV